MNAINKSTIEMLLTVEEKSGKRLVSVLVDLFNETTPGMIQKMLEAIDKSDLATLQLNAHSLKSSCANLGLEQMQLTARFIEDACSEMEDDLIPTARSSIFHLKKMYNEIRGELEAIKKLSGLN